MLDLLSGWQAELTHAEIAETLGIPKSSLTQLIKTLVSRDYLEYRSDSRGYALGPAIVALGRRSMVSLDLTAVSGPILADLSRESQETSALNVLRGDRSEVVGVCESTRRLRFSMQIGDTAPLYATSGGKAILAHLPETIRRDYLSRVELVPFTPNTLLSIEGLEKQLDAVRRTGVAFVFEEFTAGIVGLARPILGPNGFPLAAINVALPTIRYSDESRQVCLAALATAAERLTRRVATSLAPPER